MLLGENGTGKTTILQVIAAICDSYNSFSAPEKRSSISFYFHEMTKARRYHLYNSTSRDFSTELSAEMLDWRKETAGRQQTRKLWARSDAGNLGWLTEADTTPSVATALFGYGGSRIIGQAELSDPGDDDPVVSLFSENRQLRNAEEWLLQADYRASKKSTIQAAAKVRLKEIKDILITLLPDVTRIRFSTPTSVDETPRSEFHTPYGWVPLSELGFGYRSTIAWVVDFASRLFERYPDSKNPLAEPAICLVDEIDLHLHPKWQRSIMSYLSERFPNTQFIVTAHSPLIVQAAEDNTNIAVLRRDGDHVVIDQSFTGIRGWRIDQLLTSDLFGLDSARPPKYESTIKERTKILSKSRLTKKDKERLAVLDAHMRELPAGETPEDMEAMALIRSAAEKLRRAGE